MLELLKGLSNISSSMQARPCLGTWPTLEPIRPPVIAHIGPKSMQGGLLGRATTLGPKGSVLYWWLPSLVHDKSSTCGSTWFFKKVSSFT